MLKHRLAVLAAVLAVGAAAAAVTVRAGSAGASPVAMPAPGGSYVALTPARILDTRTGLGAPRGATQQLTVSTAGVAGVPTSGVSAVAVNLAVTAPTRSGFLVGYAAGSTRPRASNANYVTNQTVAAMAIVPVDKAGAFSLYSSAKAQLIADVAGYFTDAANATTSGRFTALTPSRIVDTRRRLGASTLGPRAVASVQITGTGGIPSNGVSAVVVNTTVVAPSASGYLTATRPVSCHRTRRRSTSARVRPEPTAPSSRSARTGSSASTTP